MLQSTKVARGAESAKTTLAEPYLRGRLCRIQQEVFQEDEVVLTTHQRTADEEEKKDGGKRKRKK